MATEFPYRVQHVNHTSVIFMVFANGAVRWIGPGENEAARGGQLVSITDEKEYNRLLCAAYALQGIEPPEGNRP